VSDSSTAMMTVAHQATGGTLIVIGAIFLLGVALYFWSRPR
jgi:phosphate starvation-inducible membrane PsiE